ncbi:MAG: DUF5674 family protein [Candidatus Marinimicrobia bacterium]|nr:DUF5674 family protein [Candidatus Neomarinimicrobiota bacterium]
MIKIINEKIDQNLLQELCKEYFETFVKIVVDIDREIIAVGGELHSDAEEELLNGGSIQKDLWGANFYPWKEKGERLEFTSLINIRPVDENYGMEVENEDICKKIIALCEKYILDPDENMA